MFDRMVNQIGASGASTSSTSALTRFGLLNADRNAEKSAEEPVREEDGLLNVHLAERIMKWHAEAIGRCVELSPANDVYVGSIIFVHVSLIPVPQAKEHFRAATSFVRGFRPSLPRNGTGNRSSKGRSCRSQVRTQSQHSNRDQSRQPHLSPLATIHQCCPASTRQLFCDCSQRNGPV